MSDKGSWAAICTVIGLVLGLSTLSVLDTYYANQGKQPSEEELTTNFFSHEAAFDDLVQMLATNHPSLAVKGTAAINLATIARLDTNGLRSGIYRSLLQQISMADFRYFPDSGKLILVPDGQGYLERPSKSYLYLPHGQPQSSVQHHGCCWRGPGLYILTGDRPLKGLWFIHHERTIEVAVAPY